MNRILRTVWRRFHAPSHAMACTVALSSTAVLASVSACEPHSPAAAPGSIPPVTSAPVSSATSITQDPVAAHSAAPATSAPASATDSLKPAPSLKFTGFATPESVLYDPDGDRYLVSNIQGKPTDKDNNGFISVLSPDGTITSLKWIEGGKNNVKLNGPKGLAIAKDVLYAADIDVVRMFDAKTGAPKGDVPIAGSTFLNDVAAGPDGKVYVSDTGIKITDKGADPTKTDAVYVIEKGKAKPLAKTTDLHRPNGVVVTPAGVVVVSYASEGEAYRLDEKGKKQDVTKLPAGSLDGVVALGDTLLISSWETASIYRGKLGGTFEVVLEGQKTPADIGYDTKRGRVLVPHFMQDTVEVYELK